MEFLLKLISGDEDGHSEKCRDYNTSEAGEKRSSQLFLAGVYLSDCNMRVESIKFQHLADSVSGFN